ncbi:hypothetical protein A499_20758 [Niallia nealsonii AAU1]|nr:hypothetical protein A499_20758 [Niallia nealsonii AAU1]
MIAANDSEERYPVYASKFFSISPFTEEKHMDEIIEFLKPRIAEVLKNAELVTEQEEKELELSY